MKRILSGLELFTKLDEAESIEEAHTIWQENTFSILSNDYYTLGYSPILNGVVIRDEGGNVFDHEDMEKILKMLHKTYDNVTPTQIRERNELLGSHRENRQNEHLAEQPKKIPGHVYVLKGESGWYKIGRTKDLKSRMRSFKSLPIRWELALTIKTEDTVALEEELHGIFEEKRCGKQGEWFALSHEDIEFLTDDFCGGEVV